MKHFLPLVVRRRLRLAFLASLIVATLAVDGRAQSTGDEESQIDVIVESAEAQEITVPESLSMRVRIVRLNPNEPTEIHYKYGGWGSNGSRIYGHFWKPKTAPAPTAAKPKDDLDALLNQTDPTKKPQPTVEIAPLEGAKDVDFRGRAFLEKPSLFALGEWSEYVPLSQFVPGGALNPRFLQIFVGDGGEEQGRDIAGGRNYVGASRNLQVEFEFRYDGKLLKQFVVEGPDGPIAPIVVPLGSLKDGVKPTDAAFVDHLVPMADYVKRRAEWAAAQPWAAGPKPQLMAMVTNLGGYGASHKLGIRHADPAIVDHEARTLRAMGINGFQSGPSILFEKVLKHEGIGAELARADEGAAHGYPVPTADDSGVGDEAGCPFAPGVAAAKRQAALAAVAELQEHRGFFMVQGTTVDEIGAVVDGAKEGKAHLAVCPHCRRAFHEYLGRNGLTPADFGSADWTDVAPSKSGGRKATERPWLTDRREAMLAYWTRRFTCYSSAQLFDELRRVSREENAKKRAALAAGDATSPVATQPWHYPGAMRGNTFLMGGHSLDFFEFYRHADNAFVYETSNRDPRVWSWDSYLCDVGRIVTSQPDMGQELFGVYVKPHRGAGMQRALAAVSRGARYINWYTYGPPYAKGDDWGAKPEMMELVGRTNRLIAAAEDVLYEGRWSQPAKIAVVKPTASEYWMHLHGNAPMWTAAWENAKWVYTALAHAHLPVDPIDEAMIRRDDLSRYDVIYINGPSLERAAAEKLAEWVKNGGTLITIGFGLARDEYNQPLDTMWPVLGLQKRTEPEMWQATTTYGATSLQQYDDASRIGDAPSTSKTRVTGRSMFSGSFELTVGREVLHPAADTETLATYEDGGSAVTRHTVGRGDAYVIGFFAGLEYVVPLMHDRFNMHRDYDPVRRRFAIGPTSYVVKPTVDASEPTVEGILVKHPTTGRQAVTLMNWAYGVTAVRAIQSDRGQQEKRVVTHLPVENLEVTLRGAGPVSRVRSTMLEQDLAVRPGDDEDTIVVTLPSLAEGDILRLEP